MTLPLRDQLLTLSLAPSPERLRDSYLCACVRFCDDDSALVAILRAAIVRCERFNGEGIA